MKKKFICAVCGYIYEGTEAPEKCPQCGAKSDKFTEVKNDGSLTFVCEHTLGIAKGINPELLQGLHDHFNGECSEVGMYLAMSRQADREGYPEIAEAFKRYAWEEAEHAAKICEMGACEGKAHLAKIAKNENLDAIHDSIHEMARDEARHGAGFQGLYNRYFKK